MISPEPTFLPLRAVETWTPIAAACDVEGQPPPGFLDALRRAGGDPVRLAPAWRRRRTRAVAALLAEAAARGERWLDRGRPTRRHLALLLWAYSPKPSKVAA